MRRPITAVVTAVVLLAMGAGVAFALDDALGIRSEPSDIPVETPAVAASATDAVVIPPEFTSIDAPAGTQLAAAVDELRAAIDDASGTNGEATLQAKITSTGEDDDTYILTGTPSALIVTASTEAGAARGVYDLASAVRDGRAITEQLGQTVESALPFRMVDLGAVGVTPDPAEWETGTNYSHNSGAFADVLLAEAPYIDEAALAVARDDFDTYARHVAAEGYTAIAFPGLIEYLTFDEAGVYGADDPTEHRARAAAMLAAFTPFWDDADALGLDVFLRTDMLTLTTPLADYLDRELGGLATSDPRLWDVYASGLDELYAAAPALDGVLIRIGEAGRVYDLPGWDYYSELAVTTVDAVRAMLTALTAQAERVDREVIFRSWSVGVGAAGDMHTDADSYAAVLDGIDSPALIVSTKYTLGDFYSHLPFNDTLEVGDQRRIIEFQSRREFEAFGAFPNDLGQQYAAALQRFVAANPHVEGVWTWTQDGGPWRAGPMSLELKTGFWQLYELNTELAVRLARDPWLDPAVVTADWARRWFSDDPATVATIAEAMASSREAITDGLYIGPYADRRVFAIGLEPPPMMWIFEWDILTGDSAVLDVIYAVSRDQLPEAIEQGADAVAAVDRMSASLAATDASSWKDPALRTAFVDALAYEKSTLTMLGAYREMVLRQAQWHDTGDPAAYSAWSAALASYRSAAAAHVAAYADDVQHPAWNLTAASLGIDRAERDLPAAWAARVLVALVVLWLLLGVVAHWRRLPLSAAAYAHVVAATRPWRAVDVVAGLGARDRVLLVAVPALALVAGHFILTSSPAHNLTMLAAWALFALALVSPRWLRSARFADSRWLRSARTADSRWLRSARFADSRWLRSARFADSRWLRSARFADASRNPHAIPLAIAATLGGVALVRALVGLTPQLPTGPSALWFHFWTDPTGRAIYVTLAFALFAWTIVATTWSLATLIGRRRATGAALFGIGLVLAAIGGFIAIVGLEQALTVWNDQMGLLPWGLSRILGITVYLDIPADSASYAAAFGAVLLVVGTVLLLIRGRARSRPVLQEPA